MRKIHPKLSLFLLVSALANPARAEEGLSYSETVSPEISESFEAPISRPVSDDARDAFEHPLAQAAPPRKSAIPARFDLENRVRFRHWIHSLCNLEAVNPAESTRLETKGAKKTIFKAKNKQGSLQLLLENYIDDVKADAICERARNKSSPSCRAKERRGRTC